MPLAPPTIANPRPQNRVRRVRPWRGLLIGLVATLAGAGPSFGADLQDRLFGTWQQTVAATRISLLTFEPDGLLVSSALWIDGIGPGMNEGFVNSALYSLHGSLLTLGVGDSGGGEAWAFYGHDRVTCNVSVSRERLELSNCWGWGRDTVSQPIALPDTVWVRSPQPFR